MVKFQLGNIEAFCRENRCLLMEDGSRSETYPLIDGPLSLLRTLVINVVVFLEVANKTLSRMDMMEACIKVKENPFGFLSANVHLAFSSSYLITRSIDPFLTPFFTSGIWQKSTVIAWDRKFGELNQPQVHSPFHYQWKVWQWVPSISQPSPISCPFARCSYNSFCFVQWSRMHWWTFYFI